MLRLMTILLLAVSAPNEPKLPPIEKPDVLVFGEAKMTVLEKIKPLCKSIKDRKIVPIQLPTAKKSQTQLDCEGFEYAGKKRLVELVFADGILEMVWILTEAKEEKGFVKRFIKLYGKPTHRNKELTFFLNDGVAVRNKPHEVLFISDRLKKPYSVWLKQPPTE